MPSSELLRSEWDTRLEVVTSLRRQQQGKQNTLDQNHFYHLKKKDDEIAELAAADDAHRRTIREQRQRIRDLEEENDALLLTLSAGKYGPVGGGGSCGRGGGGGENYNFRPGSGRSRLGTTSTSIHAPPPHSTPGHHFHPPQRLARGDPDEEDPLNTVTEQSDAAVQNLRRQLQHEAQARQSDRLEAQKLQRVRIDLEKEVQRQKDLFLQVKRDMAQLRREVDTERKEKLRYFAELKKMGGVSWSGGGGGGNAADRGGLRGEGSGGGAACGGGPLHRDRSTSNDKRPPSGERIAGHDNRARSTGSRNRSNSGGRVQVHPRVLSAFDAPSATCASTYPSPDTGSGQYAHHPDENRLSTANARHAYNSKYSRPSSARRSRSDHAPPQTNGDHSVKSSRAHYPAASSQHHSPHYALGHQAGQNHQAGHQDQAAGPSGDRTNTAASYGNLTKLKMSSKAQSESCSRLHSGGRSGGANKSPTLADAMSAGMSCVGRFGGGGAGNSVFGITTGCSGNGNYVPNGTSGPAPRLRRPMSPRGRSPRFPQALGRQPFDRSPKTETEKMAQYYGTQNAMGR